MAREPRGDFYPLPIVDQNTRPGAVTRLIIFVVVLTGAAIVFGCHALSRRDCYGHVWADFPATARAVVGDALNIRAGEQLLVHGAGGVTGGLLVALASLRGAEVIATAGPASQQRVKALGARQVIDYHDQKWPEQVRAMTGGHGVAVP